MATKNYIESQLVANGIEPTAENLKIAITIWNIGIGVFIYELDKEEMYGPKANKIAISLVCEP
jgi:hypothetical protein